MDALEAIKVGLSGKVASWEVVNSDGSIAQACYDSKDNLILDVGLDMVAAYASIPSCFAYFAMGTGTSASIVSMTGLETETTYGGGGARPAASGYPAYNSTTFPAASADPFVVVYQIGIQTDVGKLNGTFTELGLGPTSVKGANLFSRFRIVDSGGLPTSVTVNSDQQLRLKYQLNIRFLPIAETAYQCAVTGLDDTFDYTAGWQSLASNFTGLLRIFGTDSGLALRGSFSTPYDMLCYTLTGTPITFSGLTTARSVTPFSTIAVLAAGTGPATCSRDAYVAGTYYNCINYNWTVLQSVGTIYGLQFCTGVYAGGGYYTAVLHWLVEFNTPIVKADTHNLSFKLKFSWGRDT